MPEQEDNWQEKDRSSGTTTGPAAGSDLLVLENDYEAKLEAIEIAAPEANYFEVIVREQDTSNPTTKKVFRMNGDGQLIYKEDFEDPIMSWGASKEIAVQNVDAGTGDYAVNIKVWERKG